MMYCYKWCIDISTKESTSGEKKAYDDKNCQVTILKNCLGMNQIDVKQESRWDKGGCSRFDWEDKRIILRTLSENKLG